MTSEEIRESQKEDMGLVGTSGQTRIRSETMKHLYPKVERGPMRGRYLPPKGRLTATFNECHKLGCIQAETEPLRPMFHLLMAATGMNLCNECPVWEQIGPECKAFQAYHTDWQIRKRDQQRELEEATTPSNSEIPEYQNLSMKQIAAKLGVSLNRARQMKRQGAFRVNGKG